jgi:hypothetical protein
MSLLGKVYKWSLTHKRFHQDELVCYVLFYFYGEAVLPRTARKILIENPKKVTAEELRNWAIATNDVELLTVLGDLTGVLTPEQIISMGILPFGVLKTELDDHGGQGKETCAAELVAEFLGVAHYPEVERLTSYALHCDTTRDVRDFELPNLIKMMWRETPDDIERVMNSFLPLYEMIIRQGQNFQEEWRRFDEEQHEKHAFKIRGTDNATVRYGIFKTEFERPYMVTVARQKGFDLIFMQDEMGRIQIFTNDKTVLDLDNRDLKLDISDLPIYLRRLEMEKAGIPHQHLTDDYLRQPDIAEDEHWHAPHFRENILSMLLNGSSQAARGVPATKNTMKEVVGVAVTYTKATMFAPVMKEEYVTPGFMVEGEAPPMKIDLTIVG